MRAQTARGDLLRALDLADARQQTLSSLTLDHHEAHRPGFVLSAEPEKPRRFSPAAGNTADLLAAEPPLPRLPLRMASQILVVAHDRRPEEAVAEDAPATSKRPDPAGARLEAETNAPPPPFESLVPLARLMPVLRRYLSLTVAGEIDLARLVEQVAAGKLPRRLPHRRRSRWQPALTVLLDFDSTLVPFYMDQHEVAAAIRALAGKEARILMGKEGPRGSFVDWARVQQGGEEALAAYEEGGPAALPAAGEPLLLVTDLGLPGGAGGSRARAWFDLLEDADRKGVAVTVLAPLGPEQLEGALPRSTTLLRWSEDSRLRPEHPRGVASEPSGLEALLADLACCERIDPPLLRALRRLNPVAPANAGLEGAAWSHQGMRGHFDAHLEPALREQTVRACPVASARVLPLFRLLQHHHGHLRPLFCYDEVLTFFGHAACDSAVESISREMLAEVDKAEAFFWGLADRLGERDGGGHELLAAVASFLQRRHADPAGWQGRQALLAELVRAARRHCPVPMPGWMDPRSVEPGSEQMQLWLVRNHTTGTARLQATVAGIGQTILAGRIAADAGGVRVEEEGSPATNVVRKDLPFDLPELNAGCELRLTTASETLRVACVDRPRGIEGWGVQGATVRIEAAPLGRRPAPVWHVPAVDFRKGGPETRWVPDVEPVASSPFTFGIDTHGAYADWRLDAPAASSPIVQRFRWLAPGRFRMGSPDSEPERHKDEGPRHWVTLSRGLWLADTACTQGLWEAVMGKNPSHFKGADRPLENVSAEDVDGFLAALGAWLPDGVEAVLPSEAEWEYGCRAGTETPFSFGATVTPAQVNYDGNHPYGDGEKGLDRAETVAVKSLLPNDWGLFEMHGNVWEWCRDGMRTYGYGLEPVEDPEGPAGGDRSLRGGGWFYSAGDCRAASRLAWHPVGRLDYLGFRLALRSIEPSRVGGADAPRGDRAASAARSGRAGRRARRR